MVEKLACGCELLEGAVWHCQPCCGNHRGCVVPWEHLYTHGFLVAVDNPCEVHSACHHSPISVLLCPGGDRQVFGYWYCSEPPGLHLHGYCHWNGHLIGVVPLEGPL